MKLKSLCIAVLVLGAAINYLFAQEAVNSSGGEAVSTDGNLSFSVGLVTYNYFSGTNGSIANGVHHSYEISEVLNTPEELNILIYPNPTLDVVKVETGDFSGGMSYQLFDIAGNLITSSIISENHSVIDFSHFRPTTYLLKILQKESEVGVYKIIKK